MWLYPIDPYRDSGHALMHCMASASAMMERSMVASEKFNPFAVMALAACGACAAGEWRNGSAAPRPQLVLAPAASASPSPAPEWSRWRVQGVTGATEVTAAPLHRTCALVEG